MTEQSQDFHGKTAIVTGGARGLGAQIVGGLALGGARVFVADVLDADGTALCKALTAGGCQVYYHHLDVSNERSWRGLVESVADQVEQLDILVNNAGIIIRKTLDATTLDEWNRAFAVNVAGVFLGMRDCRALLERSASGSIVNISSTAGLIAHSDPSYTASKWAVRGLTKSAALDMAPRGIRVNSVHPATIATPLTAAAPAGHLEANRHAIPLGREATAAEIAQIVLFLASERASFVTGAEIAADGGLVTGGVAHMREAFQRAFVADI
ncbi:SDR family oxidoreductase [Paracoccus gahaiensis]|uniref:SDR family oxidoreductase n=1 Tax=Paracoccus gahaiensis TaxID=1706839 RepID=A0A4U0R6L2_9RHOB|nr:SDR family oxidoreductase [Paracoccus gahaiensis]TJZ90651.1 SDR family oxidoreductase [Paracoccus gahaiensis]